MVKVLRSNNSAKGTAKSCAFGSLRFATVAPYLKR